MVELRKKGAPTIRPQNANRARILPRRSTVRMQPPRPLVIPAIRLPNRSRAVIITAIRGVWYILRIQNLSRVMSKISGSCIVCTFVCRGMGVIVTTRNLIATYVRSIVCIVTINIVLYNTYTLLNCSTGLCRSHW